MPHYATESVMCHFLQGKLSSAFRKTACAVAKSSTNAQWRNNGDTRL